MEPVNAPFPTAWNLPFQLAAGIQTSILMSDSGAGLSVAAIRQNAGRLLAACRAPALLPGGTNAPASTEAASVIVAFGSAVAASCSHVFALPAASPRPARAV